ncbi:hypothetical protein JNUCC42_01785 [Brevibacterium sp. JNUCC-42]|nr:hypothetical protein JNUCC42_01785 [Brevibacterium sp. JNUCC-42]
MSIMGILIALALFFYHFQDVQFVSILGSFNQVGVAFAFFIVSLFLHELGHVVAAFRYGIVPRDVGVGLYMLMPTFFVDLSEVWQIPRYHRVVVNLAGIYFQLICFSILEGLLALGGGLYHEKDILRIGRNQIHTFDNTDNILTWEEAGGEYNSGQLYVSFDPLIQLYVITGFVWEEGASQPSSPNIRGQYVDVAINLWRGRYATTLDKDIGPTLHIVENSELKSMEILFDGNKVQHYTFQNDVLQAIVDKSTSFEIVFQYTGSSTRSFQGILHQNDFSHNWASKDMSPTPEAWIGIYGGIFLHDDGTFKPSSLTLKVTLINQDLHVHLSNGMDTRKLSQVVFNPKHGLVRFYIDSSTGKLLFNGSLWADDSKPPNHANWRGQAIWQNVRKEWEAKEFPLEVWNILSMLSLSSESSLLGGLWQRWCSSLHATQFCYRQINLLESSML